MQGTKGKISIKKILIAVLSLAMVVGFVILFVAASKNKKEETCKGVVITMEDVSGNLYVDTGNVRKMIMTSKELNPVGKTLNKLSSPLLTKKVEEQDWVRKASVYLGNHNLLHVKITQSKPIARIFERNGRSFYLTQSGKKIKSVSPFGVDLPVFTGFPEKAKQEKDSILLCQIRKISKFIAGNTFWRAQVAQINVNRQDEFEMIPQVGDALILLGTGTNIETKFKKLMTFYKKGLNNIGWGYYDTLDLRFEGQVVAMRKDNRGNPVVKDIVRRNDPESIENLTERSKPHREKNKN